MSDRDRLERVALAIYCAEIAAGNDPLHRPCAEDAESLLRAVDEACMIDEEVVKEWKDGVTQMMGEACEEPTIGNRIRTFEMDPVAAAAWIPEVKELVRVAEGIRRAMLPDVVSECLDAALDPFRETSDG